MALLVLADRPEQLLDTAGSRADWAGKEEQRLDKWAGKVLEQADRVLDLVGILGKTAADQDTGTQLAAAVHQDNRGSHQDNWDSSFVCERLQMSRSLMIFSFFSWN